MGKLVFGLMPGFQLHCLYYIEWSRLQITFRTQSITRLFQAMCLFAFFAFCRVGEITASKDRNAISIDQVSKLLNSSNEVEAIKITFFNYKHSYNQRPFSLVVTRQSCFCPVQYQLQYLELHGVGAGPLFQLPNGSPVPRSIFIDKLAIAIKYCGLDPSKYKGHSFRIGAASAAAEKGMSDAQIRSMGRWKSNAFVKYIRIQSMAN